MDYRNLNDEMAFESDLAMERRKASTYVEGVEYRRDVGLGGVWERLKVTSDAGAQSIGRPIGLYDTLTLPRMDTIMPDDIEDAKDEIARELCRMCDMCDASTERIMVVGLGNRDLTPDSIGTRTAEIVDATMQLKADDPELFEVMGCSEICVICPDVSANSGMKSAEIVKSIADTVKPTVVFAIDSLASRSEERLGNTVQVSNTGIIPGTGVGHSGAKIDEELLGVPVIAIGIPTVVNASRLYCGSGEEAKGLRGYFAAPHSIGKIVKNGAEIIGGGINRAFGICYF